MGPLYQAMVQDALQVKPSFIITDDSSRFARTRKAAIDTKKLLRSHGVDIRYANEPYVDPKTVAGLWLEGIQEIKNEATSREIAFHAWKGMSHNIKNRDPETGWCFKNGGPAPYGYKTTWVDRGKSSSGKPVMKSLWQLHPEQAPIVREIIVDLYTNRKMSYLQIRDELNGRGIPNASGGLWSPTSIAEMLKPHRLEQYAGTGFWNKAVTRDTVGTKYKPREEWITVEKAHPAIITGDELAAALARKREGRQAAPYGRTRESRHLLTGQNFEGLPFFTCAVCGANVIGYANNRVNWRNYVCGAHRTKGSLACTNDWRVNADWLEQRIVDEITTRFTTPERVDELVNGIASSLRTKNRDVERQITVLEKEYRESDTQISRLMDAIKSGVDASLIATEINAVKQKKDDLESQVKTLRSSIREEPKVDTQALRTFFTNFPTAYKAATIQEKRDLIRTFVRHITLVPETKEIRLELYPDHTVQSIGGGEGNRTRVHCNP